MEYVNHKGLYIPSDSSKKARYSKPIALDLFAGCGGFSLGFMQAGWEIVGAVEWEPHATITYLANLGSYPVKIHYAEPSDKERLNKVLERNFKGTEKARNESKDKSKFDMAIGSMLSGSGYIKHNPEMPPVRNFWFGDIRKIKGQDVLNALGLQQGDIDCICGGPPCQGFSAAGKQNIMDPRNSLIFEYGRMILEIQPKTFVMENVPGILNMVTPEGIPVVDALALMLSKGGYGTYEALKKTLLNTAGCGAGIKGNPEKIKRPSRRTETEPAKTNVPEVTSAEQLSLF